MLVPQPPEQLTQAVSTTVLLAGEHLDRALVALLCLLRTHQHIVGDLEVQHMVHLLAALLQHVIQLLRLQGGSAQLTGLHSSAYCMASCQCAICGMRPWQLLLECALGTDACAASLCYCVNTQTPYWH